MHERFAAWFVTGPLGHFVSGAVDWVTALKDVLMSRRR
jgi:hypothetical protein